VLLPSAGTSEHSGEFWWGLSAKLGKDVENLAQQNGGTLPALFSTSNGALKHSGRVLVWQEWESVLYPKQQGSIPRHVIVTSGYNPDDPKKRSESPTHYALVCHSEKKLALGSLGYCDLTECQTTKNQKPIKYLVGARLLEKQLPLMTGQGTSSLTVRSIAFTATLVKHCYVKLKNPRVLTATELTSLRNYQQGDDWLGLVKQLRP
jgi:hypothetical protein